jgi:hypothetical protein
MIKERRELGEPRLIPHLVLFWIGATVIALLFGFTFFSILPTSRETLVSSHIGEAKNGLDHPRSPSAITGGPATRVAAEADAPNLVASGTLISTATRDRATTDAHLEELISYWNFGTQSDREPSPTIQELQNTLPPRLASTAEMPPANGSELQHSALPAIPVAEPVSVSPNASPTPSPAVHVIDKDREQLFQAFQSQHRSSLLLDQTATATQSTALTKPVQSEGSGEHPLSSKAAFRDRVRKECGPISDRELYHQCILSFRSHSR